jgi:hypothetical protein
LLEILDDRYDRSSTLVATQVPVAEWHARFPDPGSPGSQRLSADFQGRVTTQDRSPLPMPTT